VTDSGPDRGATRRPGAADRGGPRGGPGAERRWARGEDQEPLEAKMETDFTDNVGLTVKMPGGVHYQQFSSSYHNSSFLFISKLHRVCTVEPFLKSTDKVFRRGPGEVLFSSSKGCQLFSRFSG
jgi:hypothetical protein